MFEPAPGGLTVSIQRQYLTVMRIPATERVTSLYASPHPDDPVFFWQLFSVLGEDRIRSLIRIFYELVMADDSDFGEAFQETGSLRHHVDRQTLFWLDVTGGGRTYAGGEAKLAKKHGLSKEAMNERGARRWIHHFLRALRRADLGDQSVRVLACIVDFLVFFMQRYAVEFDFNYADADVLRALRGPRPWTSSKM